MTQLLGEFVSHYSKFMCFIFRNIRKFSPVWVLFRVSTVLPFKKMGQKSVLQPVWLGYIKIFTYSGIYVLNFRNQMIFFPSLSCKKHLLAWVHDINLLWLCHVGLAAFQTSIFGQSFKEKKKSMESIALPWNSCSHFSPAALSLCSSCTHTEALLCERKLSGRHSVASNFLSPSSRYM